MERGVSDQTTNLAMPYLAPAQAQKHVTHNEALRMLDALVQIGVKDRDLATPPPSPGEGDRYIVAASPTGAWAGKTGQIAAWQDGAWAFYPPRDGWLAWISDEDKLVAFEAGAWVLAGGGASVNPTSLVGVNATADTTNRLSVAAPAALFNHDGAGHQLKVNKAAASDTASLLFQRGFSGRAEFGLMGDDDFRLKVSADGTAWKEALKVDRTTGVASVPFGPLKRNSAATAPAVTDDASAGYAPGAMWFDTATKLLWDCIDATTGAALWRPRTLFPGLPLQLDSGVWYSALNAASEANTTNSRPSNHWLNAFPFVLNARTSFDRIGVTAQTAADASAQVAQVRFGVYRSPGLSPLSPRPVRVAQYGPVTVGSASGGAVIAATISLTLDPGVYWLAAKWNLNGGSGLFPAVRAIGDWAIIGAGGLTGATAPATTNHRALLYDTTAPADWAAYSMPADLSAQLNNIPGVVWPIVGLRAA
jgi:hypothetical protein